MNARGRLRIPGTMNKTELAYAAHLEAMKRIGAVQWYGYEGMKFRLAPATFYTPDFIVLMADGMLEAHEVKGHWEDDARVKIKCAAEMFPLRFIAVKPIAKRDGGGWAVEDF